MPQSLNEHVLAAAGHGDEDAFAILWRELSPAVCAYLTARGAADPEALTSDVFIAVLPRLSDLEGGVAGLRTFLFSVAHARLVDEFRRNARRPDLVEFDSVRHDRAVPSAEHEAMTGPRTVYELLDRLSEDYRAVLALRVVADLDLEQTARVLGRSVGAVKQLQRRALVALRAEIDAPRGVTGDAASTITGST